MLLVGLTLQESLKFTGLFPKAFSFHSLAASDASALGLGLSKAAGVALAALPLVELWPGGSEMVCNTAPAMESILDNHHGRI